jgi:hypothetical protein
MISRIESSRPPGVSIRSSTAASPASPAAWIWPVTKRAVTGSMSPFSTTSRTTGAAAWAAGTPNAENAKIAMRSDPIRRRRCMKLPPVYGAITSCRRRVRVASQATIA